MATITKIAIPLAEGFEEIEAVSIIDVLRRAEFDVTVFSVTGNTEVNGSHNIKITTDTLFENIDFDKTDMLVLPGGMPGSLNLNKHEGLKKVILDFDKKQKALGAICAAPLVFGNLGVLKGKTATCYPGFESELTGADTTGANVEVSGKIVTGKGAGAAIKFALKIVETIRGKDYAESLATKMIVE